MRVFQNLRIDHVPVVGVLIATQGSALVGKFKGVCMRLLLRLDGIVFDFDVMIG